MRSYSGHGFDAALVLAITFLLTVLSACQTGPPAPTPTPFAQTRWNQATLTPNPAHAHFTPTPTRPSMREQKDALESELDQAIAKLTKAIEDDPTDAGAYNERGLAYAKQDKLEESVADFTKAIELDPNLVTAYNNRGKSYGEQRKFDEAIADLTKAIQLDADYAIAYYNRGVALQNSDNGVRRLLRTIREYLEVESRTRRRKAQSQTALIQIVRRIGSLQSAILQYRPAQTIERSANNAFWRLQTNEKLFWPRLQCHLGFGGGVPANSLISLSSGRTTSQHRLPVAVRTRPRGLL